MKVSVIANVSANGKVLLAENLNHKAAPEAMGIFMQVVSKTGNIVFGKRTFEIFDKFPGGIKGMFPDVEIVLLSSTGNTATDLKIVTVPKKQ